MSVQKQRTGPFRSDGRLLVSYPKSGRTWLMFALAEFGIDAMFTHAGSGTNWREIGRPAPGVPADMLRLPLIFLHRNPIDTAVSMFYQVTRRDLRQGTGRFFRMYLPLRLRGALPPSEIDAFVLHPLYGVEKTCAFNRAWLDHLSGRGDCLVLSYEEMRADPAAGFQRLLDFLKETGATGADLAAASDFARMRKVERTDAPTAALRMGVPADSQSAKVRKGKVGGYTDELKPATIAECRRIARAYGFETEPPAGLRAARSG